MKKKRCIKHNSNNGFIDHITKKWVCWRCHKEDEYYYPDGYVVESFVIEDTEFRIVSHDNGTASNQMWNTKKKSLINRTTHSYLSQAMRAYDSDIIEFSNRIILKNCKEPIEAEDTNIYPNVTLDPDVFRYVRTPITNRVTTQATVTPTKRGKIVIGRGFNGRDEDGDSCLDYSHSIFVNCILDLNIDEVESFYDHSCIAYNCMYNDGDILDNPRPVSISRILARYPTDVQDEELALDRIDITKIIPVALHLKYQIVQARVTVDLADGDTENVDPRDLDFLRQDRHRIAREYT